jgi:hypothetical protein
MTDWGWGHLELRPTSAPRPTGGEFIAPPLCPPQCSPARSKPPAKGGPLRCHPREQAANSEFATSVNVEPRRQAKNAIRYAADRPAVSGNTTVCRICCEVGRPKSIFSYREGRRKLGRPYSRHAARYANTEVATQIRIMVGKLQVQHSRLEITRQHALQGLRFAITRVLARSLTRPNCTL